MTQNFTLDKPAKSRMVHIDACRGLTMLLVVYWHTIELLGTKSDLVVLLSLFRMPMFLAVSGFLAFSVDYDASKCRKKSLNRLVRQLYPTIVLWLSFVACAAIYEARAIPSLLSLLCDPMKCGYWFTFALVELFFISLPLLMLFNKKQYGKLTMTVILSMVCLFFVLTQIPVNELIDNVWYLNIVGNTLNLKMVFSSGFCFFLGMIAKLHLESLERIGNKWITLVIALLCFAAFSRVYFVVSTGEINRLAHYLSAVSGMLALYCIFLKLSSIKTTVTQKIIYGLTIVGKRTLEIYLLHRFVLCFAQTLILTSGLENILGTCYEFPIVFAIAVAIAIIVLSFIKLLKLIGIYEFIFPQSTEKFSTLFQDTLFKFRPLKSVSRG